MDVFKICATLFTLILLDLWQVSDAQSWTAWSHWSMWSECSRSCGTGVQIRTRTCLQRWFVRGKATCKGKGVKYEKCNQEACADGQGDFRAYQCSQKDYQQVQGMYHRWRPYYDARQPCRLSCKADDRDFVSTFGKVIDGTPCMRRSNDLCIDGRCMRVGCDGKIGSHRGEDMCGVCYGKNRTCFQHKDVFNKHGLKMFKYHRVILIPKGARNILMTEKGNNFLALSNAQNKYLLNGQFKVGFPGIHDIAGTMFHYERSKENVETIRARGPTTEDLYAMVLIRELRNSGIHYEFWLPKDEYENDARFPPRRTRTRTRSETRRRTTEIPRTPSLKPTLVPVPKPLAAKRTRRPTTTTTQRPTTAERSTKATRTTSTPFSFFLPDLDDAIRNKLAAKLHKQSTNSVPNRDLSKNSDARENVVRPRTRNRELPVTAPPREPTTTSTIRPRTHPTWKIVPTYYDSTTGFHHRQPKISVVDNHRRPTPPTGYSPHNSRITDQNRTEVPTQNNQRKVNTYGTGQYRQQPQGLNHADPSSASQDNDNTNRHRNKPVISGHDVRGNSVDTGNGFSRDTKKQNTFANDETLGYSNIRGVAARTTTTTTARRTTTSATVVAATVKPGTNTRVFTSQGKQHKRRCRGGCPLVTEDYRHFCKADFVIRGKVRLHRRIGNDMRYQIKVKQTFKTMFPLLNEEFVWSLGSHGPCRCPAIKSGQDYVIMARYDNTSGESRLVVDANSYVKQLSRTAALNFKDLISQARSRC